MYKKNPTTSNKQEKGDGQEPIAPSMANAMACGHVDDSELFIKTVMLPKMNKQMESGAKFHFGEFIKWIGIWFLMATANTENH